VGRGAGPAYGSAFYYERFSSLLYSDPSQASLLDLGRRHPIQNLVSTPLQAWIDTGELSLHITQFVDDLELVLGAPLPGSNFERHDVTRTSTTHAWSTYDYGAVCDTFATKELDVPATAHLAVSRDARYWDLWIQCIDPDTFGEVHYDFTGVGVSGTVDRVRIVDCRNMRRVRFDGGVLGLGMTGAPYEVELHGNPDRPVRLEVQSVPRPSTVFRNGIDVTDAPPGIWAYDAGTQELTLLSAVAATDLWTITNV
jgi:hypothetical protein